MEKVYIIEECVGMYSDSHSCPIKAYHNYDKAKAECDKLNKEMNEIQKQFDILESTDTVEKNIDSVKEYIFKEARPDLFDKWYQFYHSEDDDYSWNDEVNEIENEYYGITDEAEKNIVEFINKAQKMNSFSTVELTEMQSYLTYLSYCYGGSIYEGLPSYYVSDKSIEVID